MLSSTLDLLAGRLTCPRLSSATFRLRRTGAGASPASDTTGDGGSGCGERSSLIRGDGAGETCLSSGEGSSLICKDGEGETFLSTDGEGLPFSSSLISRDGAGETFRSCGDGDFLGEEPLDTGGEGSRSIDGLSVTRGTVGDPGTEASADTFRSLKMYIIVFSYKVYYF